MKYVVARETQFQRLGAWFVTVLLLIAHSGHAIGDYALLVHCLANSGESVSRSHDHSSGGHAAFVVHQHEQNAAGIGHQIENKHCGCSSMCPFCKGYPSAYLFPIPMHINFSITGQSEVYFQSVPVYTSHLEPPQRPPPIIRPV